MWPTLPFIAVRVSPSSPKSARPRPRDSAKFCTEPHYDFFPAVLVRGFVSVRYRQVLWL